MDIIDLVQFIGNEVCEGCGPDRDCGLEVDECSRLANAVACVNDYMAQDIEEQPKSIAPRTTGGIT